MDATLLPRKKSSEAGMTLAEMAIGLAVLGLVVATSLTCLTILNRNALSGRVMSSAREIVQTNIEQAVGIPFTSALVANPPSNWPLATGTTTTSPSHHLYQPRWHLRVPAILALSTPHPDGHGGEYHGPGGQFSPRLHA